MLLIRVMKVCLGPAREARLLDEVQAEEDLLTPPLAQTPPSLLPNEKQLPPLLANLSITENTTDQQAEPPDPTGPDFEAPSQANKPSPSSTRFILGRKIRQKAHTETSTPVTPVLATIRARPTSSTDSSIPIAYPPEPETETIDEEVEEDYEHDGIRDILYEALALRKFLREAGEME